MCTKIIYILQYYCRNENFLCYLTLSSVCRLSLVTPISSAGSSSPYQRHKKFSAPDQDSFLHAGSTPNISLDSISLNSGNSYRDNILDHLPQHKWEAFVRKDIGLNGEFRMQSDSSGVNSLGGTPALGSVASLEEKVLLVVLWL